ncbi:histidine phosphatase family protein [Bacillus sp. 31A1R]|uniref:Histidine phosphatase family protein n=1 Tax=Robertmurraya mangrovi TaxID=3098077 RepID=A0ABU5IVY3_9BACI|nr:histidine phosphatase family protein [Bacillus sp. 31A1R]MDZ5471300.1 histidine phosphatase family protein [Bacillus sp. 31A1R]
MTTVYFVRHAHSTYTPNEFKRPLSEKGEADAKKVTHVLRFENIDVVLSSPYLRAIQTVEGLAHLIGSKVEIEEGFKERKLTEKSAEDFNEAIMKVWEDETFFWEGGESNLVAQQRGVEATLQVLERYKGKNIVIGTHGNIMVLIMNYFDSKYHFDFWKKLDMPDIYKLSFEDDLLINVERLWGK